jgi:ABC-type bacteriocin/lantibiotic exporter with double-glycine peptidase domain
MPNICHFPHKSGYFSNLIILKKRLLTETLYGINSIKSMATENRFIRQWEKRLGRYQHAYAQAELTNIFTNVY